VDAQIEMMANSFADLPEFEWNAGPLLNEDTRADDVWTSKQARNITHMPKTDYWFSRFYFRQTRIYIARCHHARLDDLMRFTDAFTLLIHPYRERQRLLINQRFNFTMKDAEADLLHWEFSRPDIMGLLKGILVRLEEVGMIQLPENRPSTFGESVHSYTRTRTVAGKVESVLAHNQKLTEALLDDKLLAFQNLYRLAIKEIASLRDDLKRHEKILASYVPKSKGGK
jgi:hypothetical protein